MKTVKISKPLTKIVMVLDRSGSMYSLEKDTICGFNSFIAEQKKQPGSANLTTILFDDKYEVLHEDKDIQTIEEITGKDYSCRGSTALWDAVGKTINLVKKSIKNSDTNTKVIFVITTDGEENSSVEYKDKDVKEMVKECENTGKWKFIFLGANIDSFSVGGTMGIIINANYSNTREGTRSLYSTISNVTSTYRSSVSNDIDTTELTHLK